MSSRVYVPPSSDTLFIRGFSYHHRVEDIKDFFFKEAGRCAVEFNKDDGNNGQYIALRFESREIAKDVYRRFNDREVLGDRITLTWYKELRKIKPITDPRRYGGRRDNYYGSDHYDHRSYQTSGGRSSYYKGHYAPGSSSSAGLGRVRRFSRSSSRSRSISRSASRSRSSSRSYESGEVRGHRSRSSSLGAPKRYKLKSDERKKLKQQRRLKKLADDYDSSDSFKKKLKKQKKIKKLNSAINNSNGRAGSGNEDGQMEGINKDGTIDLSLDQSTEKNVSLANTTEELILNDKFDNEKSSKIPSNKITVDKNDDKDDGMISDDYDGQILDEEEEQRSRSERQTIGSNESGKALSSLPMYSTAKHLDKLHDVNHKQIMSSKPEKNSNLEQNDDSMDVETDFPAFADNIEINIPTNNNELPQQKQTNISYNTKDGANKDDLKVQDVQVEKQQQLKKVKQSTAKLSDEKLKLLRDKKEEVEKAYKQDCETIVMVTKLLVSKDPLLEERIQKSLRENLRDIGHRCVQELREFVDRIKNSDVEDVGVTDDNTSLGVNGKIANN